MHLATVRCRKLSSQKDIVLLKLLKFGFGLVAFLDIVLHRRCISAHTVQSSSQNFIQGAQLPRLTLCVFPELFFRSQSVHRCYHRTHPTLSVHVGRREPNVPAVLNRRPAPVAVSHRPTANRYSGHSSLNSRTKSAASTRQLRTKIKAHMMIASPSKNISRPLSCIVRMSPFRFLFASIETFLMGGATTGFSYPSPYYRLHGFWRDRIATNTATLADICHEHSINHRLARLIIRIIEFDYGSNLHGGLSIMRRARIRAPAPRIRSGVERLSRDRSRQK